MDEDGNEYHHDYDGEFVEDYMKAISAYRKTFPKKEDVIENTPDPAVKEMLLRMDQMGIDTAFDRFDSQQPQCGFGLAGTCCKVCNMGRCKITPKSPRGVCGADADLIVARNLLRSAAAGVSQHGMHGREMILMLKWATEGKLDVPIIGKYKVYEIAEKLGIRTKHRKFNSIAIYVANVLMEDLSRSEAAENQIIKAAVPPETGKA